MQIIAAKDFPNPEQMIDQGYQVYQDVLDTLPKPFPVIILPRLREDFNAHDTLLAIDENNGNKVVGIALVEPIDDLRDNASRFGTSTADFLEKHFPDHVDKKVYELGGIAVSPETRQSGLGAAFYKAAMKKSDNRCVAVVTEANVAGHKTAIKGDFFKIENAVFNAPFAVKDGVAKPDAAGTHIVRAYLYACPKV